MERINKKGYMLVEIILASVIAFGVAYFIINMTIKLKNKNDDIFVETQVETDKTIITNKLMRYIMDEEEKFACSKLTKAGKKIQYGTNNIDIVNDYVTIGNISCTNNSGKVSIVIPMTVNQISNKGFDVLINYKYRIDDIASPIVP